MMTRLRAVFLLLFTVLLWSTSGFLIKLSSWNAIALNGARSAIAAIIIWAYLRRPHFTWSRPQVGGAIAYLLMLITFVAATQLTTAANAVFLQYSSPLFVILFAFLLFRQVPKPIDGVTIVAIAVGMLLFFGDELSAEGLWGNLIAIFSGVCMALMILALTQQKDGSPAETILLGNLLCALVAIPFYFYETFTPKEAVIIIFLGIFQLGLPFILYSIIVKYLTSIETVLIQSLEPVLNPIWVFFILAEAPGKLALLGGSIVFIAVTMRGIWVGREASIRTGD